MTESLKYSLVLCLWAPLTATAADGESHPLSMWQVEGQENRVFLLGSIHLLREKDHPLPSAIYDTYEEAETLIMEIDMDDLDPVASQTMATELGLIQGDRTLADLLGADAYAEAVELAQVTDIPLSLLSQAEPWYAAMNVELMMLMRLGFNPALGLEAHMVEQARKDQKEILGFETLREQLQFLDGLSPDAQREMFLQSLREGATLDELMESIIDAWRHGDTAFMEQTALREMQEFPELNHTIVVNRNRNWTARIEELLDDEDDYLVIVGTLHLVGEEGVPNLLVERGHSVTQMRQGSN